MTPRAFLFDVFGTLVDWRGSMTREVAAALAAAGLPGTPEAIAVDWRAEYDPAMAPIREGRRAYVPLDRLHAENLDRVLPRHGAADRLDAAARAALTAGWERLDPWPDVGEGLAAFRELGLVAPCSNGSIGLMARLARHAGFHWDAILGADIARSYKPDPHVYLASCAALGLAPGEVMMIASHNGDLAAARAAGLMTGFVPRPAEHADPALAEPRPTGPWDAAAEDLSALARAAARL